MKFLIQGVSSASVFIQDIGITRTIKKGILVYVWIHKDDIDQDRQEKIDKFVRRIEKLQIFSDKESRKSLWLRDIDWELMIISNFTLSWRNKKAWSVDFTHALSADKAKPMYDYLIQELIAKWITLQTWEFWAMMHVTSTLDGPMNLVLDW